MIIKYQHLKFLWNCRVGRGNVKTQRQEVLGIDNNLKEPSLYIRMPQSLLQTKSIICFYNYSYTLYYSCTRRAAVLCPMQNTNTVTVAHLIAWRMNQKKKYYNFHFSDVKGNMDGGASLRQKGNYCWLAWTALHMYC